MSQSTECATHPGVSTNLRCSKCEPPVCPQCLVHAAVGIRCGECGKGTVPPTYRVEASSLTIGIVTAVALGLAGGLALGLFVRPFGGLIHLAAFVGLGLVMAEAVSWAAGGKRGRRVQYVAAAGVAVAGLASATISIATGGIWPLSDIVAVALGAYIASVRLR